MSSSTLLDTYRPALAEFFAMTLFVWCGCGAAVSYQSISGFSATIPIDGSILLTISLAFGLAISVLVYGIAPISGGHINPAVTFAFVTSGKMSIPTGISYVVAQCLGAICGASLVWGSAMSDALLQGTYLTLMYDNYRLSSFEFVLMNVLL
jgi:aquaporin PIP